MEQGKIGRGGEVRRGQVDLYVQDGNDGVVNDFDGNYAQGSHVVDCFSDVVPKFILQIISYLFNIGGRCTEASNTTSSTQKYEQGALGLMDQIFCSVLI